MWPRPRGVIDARMADRSLRRFLLLYTLANIGSFIAFLPLLTVVVPLHAEALAGAGKVALLSETLVSGVAVATLANLAAGMLSDRTWRRGGTRMPWLWLGLAGTWISYACLGWSRDAHGMIASVLLFQLGFNTLFGPLGALFADKVPDRLKGTVSALTNLALPLGSLASAAVALPWFGGTASRLAALTLATGVLIVPLLVGARAAPADIVPRDPPGDAAPVARSLSPWAMLGGLWVAKFLVQICGNIVTGYFLFYLHDRVRGPARIGPLPLGFAEIVAIATVTSAVASLLVARWSDRSLRRKPFLLSAIAAMAAGAATLALRDDWTAALVGYALFSTGLSTFLTVDVALIAQVLPDPDGRGRDLGLMNTANTLPAIVAPVLALASLGGARADYPALYAILVGVLVLSALTLALNRRLV